MEAYKEGINTKEIETVGIIMKVHPEKNIRIITGKRGKEHQGINFHIKTTQRRRKSLNSRHTDE